MIDKPFTLWHAVGLIVGSLFMLLLMVSFLNEGVSIYRARRNTEGTDVPGYGVFEKQYTSPAVEEMMQKMLENEPPERRHLYKPRGWEFLDFYQWEAVCRFDASWKQRSWSRERAKILARQEVDAKGRPTFSETDLPAERYRCVPMSMFYQRGMGWGFY